LSNQELVKLGIDEAEQALLTGEDLPGETDPEQAAREIVMRLINAGTDEELNASLTAMGAQEVIGVPFVVHAVRWHRSAFEEGNPVFAVIDATLGVDGARVAVTCSSSNVMASLINLVRRDRLPASVVIHKAEKDTARGFRPLRLQVLSLDGEHTADE
jgi:hypothetical protein